jgi:hypothetical protein
MSDEVELDQRFFKKRLHEFQKGDIVAHKSWNRERIYIVGELLYKRNNGVHLLLTNRLDLECITYEEVFSDLWYFAEYKPDSWDDEYDDAEAAADACADCEHESLYLGKITLTSECNPPHYQTYYEWKCLNLKSHKNEQGG